MVYHYKGLPLHLKKKQTWVFIYLCYQNRRKYSKWHEYIFIVQCGNAHFMSHTMEIYNSHGSNWSPLRILRSNILICWQYVHNNNILLCNIFKSFFYIFGQIHFIHWQLPEMQLSRLILWIMFRYLKISLNLFSVQK